MRTFVAVPLSGETRSGIERTVAALRPRTRGIRWVPPGNLHLTLRFLGEVDEVRIPDLSRAIDLATAGIPPFTIRTCGVGAFPGMGSPRVLWVGLEGDLESLLKLQRRVEEELVGLGLPGEDKPFSPHLTVGRALRGTRAWVKGPLQGLDPPQEMRVHGVHLMKSVLSPEGAVYTSLYQAALGGLP